jgi:hypothetical protein
MNFSRNNITSACSEITATLYSASNSMGTIFLGLSKIKVIEFPCPHDANLLFARLSNSFIIDLRSKCFSFYQRPDDDYSTIRSVTASNTDNKGLISLAQEGRKLGTLNSL